MSQYDDNDDTPGAGLATTTPRLPAIQVTRAMVEQNKQSIALLRDMVQDLLERDVDYGRIPGTPADSLWDPGANTILSAFNCYPGQRRILKLEDTDEKIAVSVEVPLISRDSGQVVTTGLGAASTMETKHKYRWVPDPDNWGYSGEDAAKLKTRAGDRGARLFRIANPERGDLLNTILKMASKRAEVDAAESLPGVSSVLRKLFQSGGAQQRGGQQRQDRGGSSNWDNFWGAVQQLGLTQDEARKQLKVTSMKAWLESGKSLDEAIKVLRQQKGEGASEDIAGEVAGTASANRDAITRSWNALKWDEARQHEFLRKYGVSTVLDLDDEQAYKAASELADLELANE